MVMEVEDLDATVKHLEENNVTLIGVGGPQVFTHPKSASSITDAVTPKS